MICELVCLEGRCRCPPDPNFENLAIIHPGKQGCPSLVLVKILLDAGADVYAKYRGKSMKEIVELSSNNTAAQANAFDMVIAMLDVSRCAGIFVQ